MSAETVKAEIRNAIGRRVKELRELEGLTFRDAADLTPGVADSSYWVKIEQGSANLSTDVLAEIIAAFKMDFEAFFGPLVSVDKRRDGEERKARLLLERLLIKGRGMRRAVIDALEVVAETDKRDQ